MSAHFQNYFHKYRFSLIIFLMAVWIFVVMGMPHSGDSLNAGPALTGEPIQPLEKIQVDSEKAELGRRLFLDVRLSANNSISCQSCHKLSENGADGSIRSTGILGRKGNIKAPTVYNSVYNLAQFWDGRADSLEEQVDGPVNNFVEFGSSWKMVEKKLSRDSKYLNDFNRIYGGGVKAEYIKNAIAEFERSLVTLNAPFDRYLQGDSKAITQQQKNGYRLFQSYGCISCHQGRNVGGNMYQKMGAMGDYFRDRGHITRVDNGRFNVTGRESDRFYFKVPSLRLASLSGPYFHDGTAKTLDEAVRIMGRYQLGRDIPKNHRKDIIAFIESLVGEHPLLKP